LKDNGQEKTRLLIEERQKYEEAKEVNR